MSADSFRGDVTCAVSVSLLEPDTGVTEAVSVQLVAAVAGATGNTVMVHINARRATILLTGNLH